MDLSVWLAGEGTADATAYSESTAPDAAARTMMRATNRHGPRREPGWWDLWPAVPILVTKCIFSG